MALGVEIRGGGGAAACDMVDEVLSWRKKRGDFDYDDDDEQKEGFLGDEVPQLPCVMQGVS